MGTDLASLRQDYDWRRAFEEAAGRVAGVDGYRGALAPFTLDDVAEVVAADAGEADARAWVGAFRLRDGRFVAVVAGCDYSGWDCQASGSARVADTLADLVRWGLGRAERARLGLALRETTDDDDDDAAAREE